MPPALRSCDRRNTAYGKRSKDLAWMGCPGCICGGRICMEESFLSETLSSPSSSGRGTRRICAFPGSCCDDDSQSIPWTCFRGFYGRKPQAHSLFEESAESCFPESRMAWHAPWRRPRLGRRAIERTDSRSTILPAIFLSFPAPASPAHLSWGDVRASPPKSL